MAEENWLRKLFIVLSKNYSASKKNVPGWVDGWVGGWMDGWMDGWIGCVRVKAVLRIAYSNQK